MAWGSCSDLLVEGQPTQHPHESQARFTSHPAKAGGLGRPQECCGRECSQNTGAWEESEACSFTSFASTAFSFMPQVLAGGECAHVRGFDLGSE